MSCEEGRKEEVVQEKEKVKVCSEQLKRKSRLFGFPLSFSGRERSFRGTNKGTKSRTSGACRVARGIFGFYRAVYVSLQENKLRIHESPDDFVSSPIHSIDLPQARCEAFTHEKPTVTSVGTTFWFRVGTEEECRQWLYAFQHVPGLYRKVTDFYEVGEICGEGATCQVHDCFSKLTGEHFALKSRSDLFDEVGRSGMYNELRILQILDKNPHPAIPSLKDYFFDKNGDIKIVMEFLNGGELLTKIADEQCLEEEVSKDMFRQVVEGIAHLHKNGIAHRDIKPSNIMLVDDPEQPPRCKIIDYDLAKVNYAENWFACNPCGTPEYMAPEIFECKVYSQAIDVWSLGCLLYVMLTGRCPFRGATNWETRCNVLDNNIHLEDLNTISSEARDLITHMLQPCPEHRLTAKGVLKHPWLTHTCGLNQGSKHDVLQGDEDTNT